MIKNEFIRVKVSSGLKSNYSNQKREYSEKLGYKFLFVIDKNYDTLSEYLKKGL